MYFGFYSFLEAQNFGLSLVIQRSTNCRVLKKRWTQQNHFINTTLTSDCMKCFVERKWCFGTIQNYRQNVSLLSWHFHETWMVQTYCTCKSNKRGSKRKKCRKGMKDQVWFLKQTFREIIPLPVVHYATQRVCDILMIPRTIRQHKESRFCACTSSNSKKKQLQPRLYQIQSWKSLKAVNSR